MSNQLDSELESTYKQFRLTNIPIFQNREAISIRRLFKVLTITELKDLPAIEAMNFYLYCHFFKNRLLYSPTFEQNLNYINSKAVELKQRIKVALEKYDHMLKTTKSESDCTWIDNNIAILNDGLLELDDVPNRCDYYDAKLSKLLKNNQGHIDFKDIESECATEFAKLSTLFSKVGQIIGGK